MLTGKSVEQCDLLTSKLPNSWEFDSASKTRHSEPLVWTSTRVKLPDYPDNIPKHSSSSSREVQTSKQGDNNICRSEYIFTTPFPNINATKNQLDNSSKRATQDSKNTTGRKSESNLSSYPIGLTRPNDFFPLDKPSSNPRRRTDIVINSGKSKETKIRHSYSQDSKHQNSVDLTDFVDTWSAENGHRLKDFGTSKFNEQSVVVNVNDLFGLEVIGEGIHALAVNNRSNTKGENDFIY